MRQVWITRVGDPSVLQVREAADPTPGAGEVRVQVEAAGVNFADVMARMGLYPDAPPLPAVVGYEVAGTIDAVGDGVDAARVGERVVAMVRFGGYSSAVVAPSTQVVRRPDTMDAATGAALPVVYATAWMMIEEMGRVRAGDRVLVHSAGGGVGLAALDLLLRRGAVAVGVASQGKHATLLERGYARVVDGRARPIEEAFAGEPGFDLILDPVGGASWASGLRLLRAGGRLACFGFSANNDGETRNLFRVARNLAAVPWWALSPVGLMNANKGVLGVNMGHLWDEGPRVTGWLREVLALWEEGVVRPAIHAEVPFDRAPEAHQILHGRRNLGKVLLRP